MAKIGRPTMYTQELGVKICNAVAQCTDGLKEICEANKDFPHHSMVYEWRYKIRSFADIYTDAKRQQAELHAESTIDLAASAKLHTYIDKDGNTKVDPGYVAALRLEVDTKKWVGAKLAPRLYGDKTEVKVTVIKHEDALKELE